MLFFFDLPSSQQKNLAHGESVNEYDVIKQSSCPSQRIAYPGSKHLFIEGTEEEKGEKVSHTGPCSRSASIASEMKKISAECSHITLLSCLIDQTRPADINGMCASDANHDPSRSLTVSQPANDLSHTSLCDVCPKCTEKAN